MRLFLTGISCVGKTTIGQKIGESLDIKFFDLDKEIGDDIIRKIKYRLAPGGIRGVKDSTFR